MARELPPPMPSEGEIRAGNATEDPNADWDRYCPTCQVSYPAKNESQHAGH